MPAKLVAVQQAHDLGISLRRACQLFLVLRAMHRYQHVQPGKDAVLMQHIKPVMAQHPSWGYRLVTSSQFNAYVTQR